MNITVKIKLMKDMCSKKQELTTLYIHTALVGCFFTQIGHANALLGYFGQKQMSRLSSYVQGMY